MKKRRIGWTRFLAVTATISMVSFTSVGQVKVGDNPDVINNNSALEVESTNKGVLIPRVTINDVTTAAPLPAPVTEGMLVYSTNGAVANGFYYWNGTQWVTIGAGGETLTTLVDNGNGSFTYTSEDGTQTTYTDIDTQLTEAQVDAFTANNGYLTSFTEVDGSTTNELQTISKTGNTITLSNGGGSYTDAVNDADTSVTNEIQTISKTGDDITLSNGGGTVTIGGPAGAVTAFAGGTAPNGYLECNGSAVSRTTYANLFAAIGTTYGAGDSTTTFNLPDLRGEFVRGWDNGRGVDNARGIGTSQGDAIRNIEGQWDASTFEGISQDHGSTFSGALYTDTPTGERSWGGSFANNNTNILNVSFDASRVVPTADENRPRNIAMMYIIKF